MSTDHVHVPTRYEMAKTLKRLTTQMADTTFKDLQQIADELGQLECDIANRIDEDAEGSAE